MIGVWWKCIDYFEKVTKEYKLRVIRTVWMDSFRSIRSRGTFEQTNVFYSVSYVRLRRDAGRYVCEVTRITCTLQTPVLTHTWARLDASKWPPASRNSGDTFAYSLTTSFYFIRQRTIFYKLLVALDNALYFFDCVTLRKRRDIFRAILNSDIL